MKEFIEDTFKLISLLAGVAIPPTLVLAITVDPIFGLGTFVAAIILTVLTWIFYAKVMRLKGMRDNDEIKLYHYPYAFVILPVGLFFDFVLNVVIGAYWKEWPQWQNKEWLLTARLKRWKDEDFYPERVEFATRVCKKLNKHDENHC